MKTNKQKCPICDGKGKIDEPNGMPKNLMKERANMAKKLRGEGYSIREIMKLLNYKSPLSIQMLLKK